MNQVLLCRLFGLPGPHLLEGRNLIRPLQIAESKEKVFAVLLLNSLQPCEQPVCQVIEQNHGFHLAGFGLSFKVQDHGMFLMDTDLIPPEHADQSVICLSIFIYITCTNTWKK